jgi:hypothetical protein
VTAVISQLALTYRQQKPWVSMIVVSAAMMALIIIYKSYAHPIIPYSFLLADYHFGFMKRALVGTIIALFEDKTSISKVFYLTLAVWLTTMGLFVLLFKRTFGFSGDRIQLFVFAFGSPFFFKNFFHTLGFFDIYGCLVAIILLLVPVNRLFPLLVGTASALLVLSHHLHFLLYVPAIFLIAIIRLFCLRPFSRFDVVGTGLGAALPCAAFIASVVVGNAPVPPHELISYMQSRAADPLPVGNISIWYTSVSEEFAKTASMLPMNLPRLPVFLALFALHWPLVRFMRALHASIAVPAHRIVVNAGIAGITAGYAIIFIFVYDYARWFSNWAVCMILVMHALAMLVARNGVPAPAFAVPQTAKRDTVLGWIVAAIPRAGTQIPF